MRGQPLTGWPQCFGAYSVLHFPASILFASTIFTLDMLACKHYTGFMNRLATDKRTAVIAALCEGTSINAACRVTGVARHTVLKLLRDLGCAAAAYHDVHVRNLRVRRVQADEIWAFVYGKDRNLTLEQVQVVRAVCGHGQPLMRIRS